MRTFVKVATPGGVMSETAKGCLPANVGAHRAGMSRERFIRCIQAGDIDGAFIGGRWYVDERALAEFVAHRAPRSGTSAPGRSC